MSPLRETAYILLTNFSQIGKVNNCKNQKKVLPLHSESHAETSKGLRAPRKIYLCAPQSQRSLRETAYILLTNFSQIGKVNNCKNQKKVLPLHSKPGSKHRPGALARDIR